MTRKLLKALPLVAVALAPSCALAQANVTIYNANIIGLVPAAAATDVFCLTGSATKNVRLMTLLVSGIASATAVVDTVVVVRSTSDTGGTSTAPVLLPIDPNNPAATSVVTAYTANPTVGTLIGQVQGQKLTLGTSAGGLSVTPLQFDFENLNQYAQGISLRGAAQQICLNLNGQTISGGNLDVSISWTEQ